VPVSVLLVVSSLWALCTLLLPSKTLTLLQKIGLVVVVLGFCILYLRVEDDYQEWREKMEMRQADE